MQWEEYNDFKNAWIMWGEENKHGDLHARLFCAAMRRL
jgi:hypothetical protein